MELSWKEATRVRTTSNGIRTHDPSVIKLPRDGADVGIGVFELTNILLSPQLVRLPVRRNSMSL